MIDIWKNNLLNLPDSIFFDIMRNYLGDLKTPFNKHDLIRSLTAYIMKKEVKDRIFRLVDRDDARLLTAIALMKTAAIDEIYEFTKKYYSFLELHNRIANLQERLLICIGYPEKNRGRKLIMLNPVFEEELRAGFLNSSTIFETLTAAENTAAPWLNEQLLAAFLSFAVNNKSAFAGSGLSRKKAESAFESIFQNLPDGDTPGIISFLHDVCRELGFLEDSRGNPEIRLSRINEFGERPVFERTCLIAAAAVPAFSRDCVKNLDTSFKIVSGIFNSLGEGVRLHRKDLKSVYYLIRRQVSAANPDANEFTSKLLTDALCYCGFLTKEEDFRIFNSGSAHQNPERLRIQANFEITAPGILPLRDEISAALCSNIKSCDLTRIYELTKPAFAAALDSGLSMKDIAEALAGASAVPIPQNISFSMQAWEKEYKSISLNYGVVMTVSRERLPIIEHTPGLKDFVTAEPAPGVFILDPAGEAEWRKAFADAGFDMLPGIHSGSAGSGARFPSRELHLPDEAAEGIKIFKGNLHGDPDSIMDELGLRITKLRMSEENRQKLGARVKKKLILSESQLVVSNRPEERGEAGGLDHRAKIRLAERAIELENLLEITTARDLELDKTLVKPLRLEKTDTEQPDKPPVYHIIGIELPDEKEFQIPVTRISYLKMLKSSLFTP